MPKAVVVTTIRVEPALYQAAQASAAARGVSVNAWIVEAMREKAAREPRRGAE